MSRIGRALRFARARPRAPGRRSGASAACRTAVRARARHRTESVRSAVGRSRARTAHRFPWGRRTCVPSATGSRRRAGRRRRGSLPAACDASVCTRTPRARQISAIAARSEIAPISLLTSISDTSSVSARSAARTMSAVHAAAGVRLHQRDGEDLLSRAACRCRAPTCVRCASSRYGCGLVRRAAPRAPRRAGARLFASVAPDVKMISRGRRADQRGDLRARRLDALLCREPRTMGDRGRIALRVRIRQAIGHGRGDARIHRRGGGVVEVDSHLTTCRRDAACSAPRSAGRAGC